MQQRHLPAVLIASLALLAGIARGDGLPSLPDFDVADRLSPADPLPERETRWANTAVTLTDVVYASLPGYRALHLDLYRPTGGTAPRPLVVFLHGGGWAYANARVGSPFRNFPAVLATLVERGYVVASIEYRFSSEAHYPAQLEDVQTAIRYLRNYAARFGIDGRRVGLWGMSGGAYLAGMGALNCAEGACVQGWVGWFGPYDLSAYVRAHADDSDGKFVRALLGCAAEQCEATTLDAASPVQYVDGKDPPALLVQGMTDASLAASQPEELARKLRSAGVPVDVLFIPQVGHGLIGPTDAVTKDASRQALTATFDFFDRVLGVRRD
jgi:acetyl esterase/lipase